MKHVKLGGSDVEVSEICLGTMTFGSQTAEPDAHAQLDRAADAGMSFIDTAEMYPVNPVRRETIGVTEQIIGRWMAREGNRDRVQIATKITGPSQMVRDSAPYHGATVRACIDASLRRLQTDRIDLYQLHWPVRGTWAFRQNWTYAPTPGKQQVLDHMADILDAVGEAVSSGKLRAFGLSNETAWGLARWCDVADRVGGPRVAAIQNEYSLLYRLYDTDLAETALQEDVTLLGFSPLAAGLLTGKYAGGALPDGSRAAVDKQTGGMGNLGGRKTTRAIAATEAYRRLAAEHGWDPVHMAIAWQLTRPFKNIPIIGATDIDQLDHLIAGLDRPMAQDLVKAIDRLHKEYPLPY
ncbi:aldo/keto reductase [Paracoccus sp. R12_1]|uniref:aldo/keto reductase n=1 Tax=unclassified Paracoccus (in: a-proteobacteria) TaxID=2688777 RepID=UPI001ADA40D8|nr:MULTISPECIES: aldo/keto reductase [unclassified Paracoccus (in: a-proteobacteria)]MBO9455249.1 aldo/keto reductase [Paracoccus sp. R12_2]MBO9486379.1 aldo/keto reductase [Paracoccus sp. R12_1]